MSYIGNSEIELRLGTTVYVQLTDDAGTGSADADVADEARLGAEGEVNSYLARRYRVPVDLSTHPELAGLLASVSLDLAEYRLHARRPPVPDAVTDRYRGALDWLAKVAAGKVELPSELPLQGNPVMGIGATSVGGAALLSRDELEQL